MTIRETLIPAAAGLFLGVFAVMPNASAAFTTSESVGGDPTTGSNLANFDNLALGSAGEVGGLGVSFGGGAEAVAGTNTQFYTAPYISNSQGVPFGNSQVSGYDTTPYLTTGLGTVTLTLSGPANYLGLLWGSIDSFNNLSFYNNGTLVGTVSGAQVMPGPIGNLGPTGTEYVNIMSSLPFDTVVDSSGGWSFEFDDVAYGAAPSAPVPEPMSFGLLGLGVLGSFALMLLGRAKLGCAKFGHTKSRRNEDQAALA